MRTIWLAGVLATILIAPEARAVVPHHGGGFVAPPGARVAAPAAWSTPARATAAFDRLVAATGAWQAVWDRDTDVPVRLWGAGVAAPGADRDPATALAAARAVIEAHLDLLAPGSTATDLELIGNAESPADGLRTVTFAQRWRGMRVVGATVTAMFKRDHLIVLGSSALPDVAARVPATAAAPSTLAARQWVAAAAGLADVEVRSIDAAVVFPGVRTRAAGAATPDVTFTVTRPVVVADPADGAAWTVWIDAASGDPVARASRRLYADGTLVYNTPARDALGPRIDVPAAYAAVVVDGQPVTTDFTGRVQWSSAAASMVVTALTGPFVAILDGGGHALAQVTLPLDPGGTASWAQATDEFPDGQITAFAHANLIKQLVRQQLNPFLPWVDGQIQISVNEPQLCNAFADLDPDSLHFFNAGGVSGFNCANTARIPDVVYHETGHNYHFRSMLANGVIGGIGDFGGEVASLSEGLADTMSTAVTGDPIIGPGFFVGDPNGIRNLDPVGIEKVYPDDIDGEPHDDGEIIGEAIFDLRKALIAELGAAAGNRVTNRVFNGIAGHSTGFAQTYADALAADDDDGDLANGTPHQCAISKAFIPHGLAATAAGGVAIGTPTVDAGVLSVPIAVPALDCPGLAVTAVDATWRVRGDVTQAGTFALASAGAAWTGALPAVPDGTVLQYQITITFSDASTAIRPLNHADPYYETYVGAVTTIRCDDFETDPGWIHAATTGVDEWARGPGGIAPAAGDPTEAVSGTSILGTDLADNGLYAASSDSYAETPAIDVSGYAQVRLQYRRWLDVDDGFYDRATISAGGTELWHNAAGTDAGSATSVHRDGEWRFQDVDLTAASGSGSVAVRFGLVTDDQRAYGGWSVDDVCVVGVGTTCGDALVRGAEECDDGNTEDGDGCSATCAMEPPDTGGCCSAGADPRGALAASGLGGLGLLVLLRRRRRRG